MGRVQVRIMLSVLQFRLNKRYVEANPPFVGIELDQSDSGREGCAVSTLTITSEPKDWQGAVQARTLSLAEGNQFSVCHPHAAGQDMHCSLHA